MINIALKDRSDANANAFNVVLSGYRLDNDEEFFQFLTVADNQAWLDDINHNPDSPQYHLKPADRDYTMEELCKAFPIWTNPGILQVDIKFGRTSESDCEKVYDFICRYYRHIEMISGLKDLCEYISVTPEPHIYILDPEPSETSYEYPDHMKKLTIDNPRGELASTGFRNFATIIADVDSPRLLQAERDAVDPTSNAMAETPEGLSVIGIPPLKPGKEGGAKVIEDYNAAVDIGCRDSFASYVLQHYASALKLRTVTLNSQDEARRVIRAMGPIENMNKTALANFNKVQSWLKANDFDDVRPGYDQPSPNHFKP